ncbi:MAG: chromate resistance protein [Rubrivivax sp.]|nr:MAG: chromate resistance protein [Rubrivivax sp.]
MWTLLLLTLPAQPAAVRLRVWRTLKAMGSGALRDGAYTLPQPHSAAFSKVAEEVVEHGGTAFLADMTPRSPEQLAELEALFDRTELYIQWRDALPDLRQEIEDLSESEARRRYRATSEALQAIERIDFFSGEARDQANAELALLRRDIDAQFSSNEPQAHAGGVPTRAAKNFQNKRWATRARPWVDRLACAWLIRRFIDQAPTFIWLKDTPKLPRGAIGYDFDGAQFTHIGPLVSFEVMAASFGLQDDPKLRRIGAIVHFLDVGGMPVPEAAGLECVLAGLRDMHADDDALVEAANVVFDALYATPPSQAASSRRD